MGYHRDGRIAHIWRAEVVYRWMGASPSWARQVLQAAEAVAHQAHRAGAPTSHRAQRPGIAVKGDGFFGRIRAIGGDRATYRGNIPELIGDDRVVTDPASGRITHMVWGRVTPDERGRMRTVGPARVQYDASSGRVTFTGTREVHYEWFATDSLGCAALPMAQPGAPRRWLRSIRCCSPDHRGAELPSRVMIGRRS